MPGTEPTYRSFEKLWFTASRERDIKALATVFEDEVHEMYFGAIFDTSRDYRRDWTTEEAWNNSPDHRNCIIAFRYSSRAPPLSDMTQAQVDQQLENLRFWAGGAGMRWSNCEDDKLVFKVEWGPYYKVPRSGSGSGSDSRLGSHASSLAWS